MLEKVHSTKPYLFVSTWLHWLQMASFVVLLSTLLSIIHCRTARADTEDSGTLIGDTVEPVIDSSQPVAEPENKATTKTLPQNSSAASSAPGAEPTEFERRLFRIYRSSEPVPQARWDELVGSRRQEHYTVTSGDTLWEISQTLFGDGAFWSKLWAENGGLENPHYITPGQQIYLVAGSESSAPGISVSEKGAGENLPVGEPTGKATGQQDININSLSKNVKNKNELNMPEGTRGPVYREEALKKLSPEEIASGINIEVDELVPKPEIPDRVLTRPVLKNLPPSFVKKVEAQKGQFDITGLDAHRSRSLTVPATVIPNSYLADKPPEHIGSIVEIETQEKVASVGQNVFIKLDQKANIGDHFTVIYPKNNIEVKNGASVGPVVEYGGRVEVVGIVKEDKNVYRALVVLGMNPVRVNSFITREALPKTNYSRRGTRTTIDAKIIGGEYSEVRTMLGESSVVYLDQGHSAGLNAGDILPIQAQRSAHREGSQFPDWSKAIGLIKLVKVEESVSTGIILEASEQVLVGDRTGGRLATPAQYHEEAVEEEGQM